MPERLMLQASPISHGAALLAYLVFAAVLLRSHGRGAMSGRRGAQVDTIWWVQAAVLTAAWAGAVACAAWRTSDWGHIASAVETLRTGGWLLLLMRLREAGRPVAIVPAAPRWWERGARWQRIGWLPAVALLPLLAQAMDAAAVLAVLRLLLAVAGLVLLELLFRAGPLHARWGIRLACMGVGAIFAYDVYLYADAVLWRRIDADIHAARGAVNALCTPMLLLAMRREPNWRERLQLSRHAALRSVALLASAAYLLVMSAAAWGLQHVGAGWGRAMQLACLFGAVLVLFAVLGSGTARARLKVVLAKHLYQGRYDYRAEWQRLTAALAEQGDDLPRQAIEALARLVESPAGVLWLPSGAAYRPAACWNMALTPAWSSQAAEPLGSPLCRLMTERSWVLEATAHGDGTENPEAGPQPAWLGSGTPFWLVTPLMLGERLFGFVGLAPARAPMALDWEMRDMLVVAGRQAASSLAHRQSADSLAEARQFASFHRMSAFVAHDLKNLAGQLALLLSNAKSHRHERAFQDDMLVTVENTLAKMQQLLARLGRDSAGAAPSWLCLGSLLQTMAAVWGAMRPAPALCCDGVAGDRLWVLADAARLERVLGHLVQNAVEATPPQGSVSVRLGCRHGMAVIVITDTGTGMSPAFIRERLFQPFDTTKPAGMGIGVFEAREYVLELGGTLTVESCPGTGSAFTLMLPVATGAAPPAAHTRRTI